MNPHSARANQRGLGLIELMVALLLGLFVAGSAIAIFATNRQTYAATESLGRLQENGRLAYEMMARDLREAGGTPCDPRTKPVANVTTGGAWWQTWGAGVVGYHYGDTGLPADMKSGTDAVVLLESDDTPISVVSHDNSSHTFVLNAAPTAFKPLDLVVACDYRQSSIFQINAVVAGSSPPYKITYAKTGLNCSTDLSWYPFGDICTSTKPGIQYNNDAMVGRLRSVEWYVNTSNQLIQTQLGSDGTTSSATKQAIADGVTNMTLTYLVSGANDYVSSSSVGSNWSTVDAVRVALTLQGQDNGQGQARASTSSSAFTRTVSHVVSLRNHLQ
ncbi:MAG TPA: PilW family protein [Xanthomonadaceae bacterium]|jgi:type IV pilus assembly protein PilW